MSSPIPRLPDLEIPNPTGSCWSCIETGSEDNCDRALPFCFRCSEKNIQCAGYHARLRWNRSTRTCATPRTQAALIRAVSSLGLPAEENRLLLHVVKNISRISLAVDYEGNGYRRLVSIAMHDSALLNALLALSGSHLHRWKGEEYRKSQIHMRKSILLLQRRLSKPSSARSETTLMTMLILLVFELCEGNDRWKHHFNGLLPWIRCRQDCTDIDPFLISHIVMITTQVILHMTGEFRQRGYVLLEALSTLQHHKAAIDPIYSCSLELPHLITEAGHLHDEFQEAQRLRDSETLKNILIRAEELQDCIESTRLRPDVLPDFNLIGVRQGSPAASDSLSPVDTLIDRDTRIAARASAEIFRYALQIYVYRISHDPMTTGGCPQKIRDAIDDVFELLPTIPDTVGPGSFLGWALVVIGAEIDRLDQREYLKRRLESLTLLALNHGVLGLQVLDEIWRRRDSLAAGLTNNRRCRWQEVMDDMRVDIALI